MANKFNRFLGTASSLGDKGNLGDFQHAARLFVDDTFRLAPKNKFLFYVVFNINPSAMRDTSFNDRHKLEVNYLVSSADLPKYTIETENLNQYNKKTTSYKKIVYDPVNIKFHDDNNGITNSLWALYYGYYFRDRLNGQDPYTDIKPPAYLRSTYGNKQEFPFRYGLDNDSSEPFFNSIQIVTLARQRFFSYLLCNPKIIKWDHDNVDYKAGGDVLQNSMNVAYDAVIYNSGTVETDDPAGFALLHYDTVPSPLTNENTLENGINGIFESVGDLFNLNSFAGRNNRFQNLRSRTNVYQNLGNRRPAGAGSPSFFGTNYPTNSGGLQNFSFGSFSNSSNLTTALGVGASLLGAARENIFRPNIAGAINQTFSGSISPPGSSSSNTQDVYGPSLPGGTAGEPGFSGTTGQIFNDATTFEPGFSGSSGEILSDAISGQAEADAWGGSALPEYPLEVNTADFFPDPLPDTTAEILENSNYGTGDAAFDIGTPFG